MRREGRGGEVGRVEGDPGASFGDCVARSKKGRSVRHSGSGRAVFGPVKEMPSESVERMGKRIRLL